MILPLMLSPLQMWHPQAVMAPVSSVTCPVTLGTRRFRVIVSVILSLWGDRDLKGELLCPGDNVLSVSRCVTVVSTH